MKTLHEKMKKKDSFIVEFLDAYLSPGGTTINIVLEWMDAGSLQGKKKERKKERKKGLTVELDLIDIRAKTMNYLEEDFIIFCLQSILNGLKELHERRLLHRDLKPANVLLSRNGRVK